MGANRRGRPRSAEADAGILEATIALVVDGGYDAVTMEAVAVAAGVAKTTVYRRWRSKPELVVAAFAHLTSAIAPPDTGSLRGDLVELVSTFVEQFTGSPYGSMIRAAQLAVAESPALAGVSSTGFLADRRRAMDVIVDRAILREELRPGADRELIFDLAIGSVYLRTMVHLTPVNAATAERIVDVVLLGYPNVEW